MTLASRRATGTENLVSLGSAPGSSRRGQSEELEYLPIVWTRVRGKSSGTRGDKIQVVGRNVGRGIAMRVRTKLHVEGLASQSR
jgi:hypothetical protein